MQARASAVFRGAQGCCFDVAKTEASFAVKSGHSLAGADTKLEGVGVKFAGGGKRTLNDRSTDAGAVPGTHGPATWAHGFVTVTKWWGGGSRVG